jgi:hypothetical protein
MARAPGRRDVDGCWPGRRPSWRRCGDGGVVVEDVMATTEDVVVAAAIWWWRCFS